MPRRRESRERGPGGGVRSVTDCGGSEVSSGEVKGNSGGGEGGSVGATGSSSVVTGGSGGAEGSSPLLRKGRECWKIV